MASALLLRHLGFEHVGVWRQLLEQRWFTVASCDAPRADLSCLDVDSPNLVIALGGPSACMTGRSIHTLTACWR